MKNKKTLLVFDLFDHFDGNEADAIEIHQLAADGSWWKIAEVPIGGLPIFGEKPAAHSLFKIGINGQSSHEYDSDTTKPEA